MVVVVVAVVGIAGAIFVGVLRVSRGARSRRTAVMEGVASRIGWGFREQAPIEMLPDLDRFELFRPGSSKELRNILTSPAGERRAVLFDYSYSTGSGDSQRTHRQTVFYAVDDELALPSFSLRPERFYHRVAGVFGYQDIDLEGHPEFSRAFLLRGEDEALIRAAFDDDGVAEFFERRLGTCAAGLGRELLYWRPGGHAGAGEVEALIRDGSELAERFRAASGGNGSA